MSEDLARHAKLEQMLASVLDRGTWVASGIIVLGLILEFAGWPQNRAVVAGILLFIVLPVVRVMIMLVVFLGERDYRFAAIAALVLAIIVLGALLGIHMAGHMPG